MQKSKRMTIIATSAHRDTFKLSHDERRFFVVNTDNEVAAIKRELERFYQPPQDQTNA